MSTGYRVASSLVPGPDIVNPAGSVLPLPAGALASSSPFSGAETKSVPSIAHSSYTGALALGFVHDFYNRVIVSPAAISLGNVVSAQTQNFTIWNGWLASSQTLNTITSTGTSGLTLTSPGSTPLSFTPNQTLTWTLGVSTDGDPTVNASYVFAFADGESQTLTVTGNRVTAWTSVADWSTAIKERIEHKTDVMIGWSGVEMRRALRIAPRRTFRVNSTMVDQDRRIVESSLFDWSARVWALPIFTDGQILTSAVAQGAVSIPCSTVNRDFQVGAMAMLYNGPNSYEIVAVSAISSGALGLLHPTQNAWASGTRLYPARIARLLQYPKLSRENGSLSEITAEFTIVETCDVTPNAGSASYRGYPVLELRPDESHKRDMQYARKTAIIDNATGLITVDDQANMAFPTYSHTFFLQDRAARQAFRQLLYYLQGRVGEIWVPSFVEDLSLQATVSSTSQTLIVEWSGYTRFVAEQVGRKDIRIELNNGTVLYRRITGSSESGATENISIDSPLGISVAVTDVRQINFLSLCRGNADAVEIDAYMGDGVSASAITWRVTNHDV